MSKVRGRSREDPMPEEWWPRGATQSLRSGAAAKRSCPTSEIRGGSQECQAVTAQEWPRGAIQSLRPGVADRRSHTPSEVGATDWRSHPAYEARVRGLEEPPSVRGQGRRPGRSTHVQEVVAVLAQEGLEELSHVEGQEGWW